MREQERTLFEAPRLVGAALPLAPERDGRARVRVPVVAQVEAVLRACEEHPADHSGAEEEVSNLNVIVTYSGEVRGGEGKEGATHLKTSGLLWSGLMSHSHALEDAMTGVPLLGSPSKAM